MLNNVAGSYNPFIPSPDYVDPNQFEEEFDAQEDDHEAESAVDDRKGFIGRRGSQNAAKKRAAHPMKEAAQHKANGLGLFEPKTFLAQANQAFSDLQLVESAEKTDLEKNPEFTDIPIMRAPVKEVDSSYGGLYELLGEIANILGNADILKLKENLKLLKENSKAVENNSKEIESLVTSREELEKELENLSNIKNKEEKEKKLQEISLKIKDLNEKTNTLLNNYDLTHDQMKRMQDNVFSLTQLMAEVINLMGESSSIDIQNTKKVMEAEFQKNITQMKEQIKKNQEAMEKAKTMKEKMGCIAKVIGHIVTAITVLSTIAAVFTGGASLVIAALALGLLAADTALQAHELEKEGAEAEFHKNIETGIKNINQSYSKAIEKLENLVKKLKNHQHVSMEEVEAIRLEHESILESESESDSDSDISDEISEEINNIVESALKDPSILAAASEHKKLSQKYKKIMSALKVEISKPDIFSPENRGSLAKLISMIGELKDLLRDMQSNKIAIMKKMSELSKKALDSEISGMKDQMTAEKLAAIYGLIGTMTVSAVSAAASLKSVAKTNKAKTKYKEIESTHRPLAKANKQQANNSHSPEVKASHGKERDEHLKAIDIARKRKHEEIQNAKIYESIASTGFQMSGQLGEVIRTTTKQSLGEAAMVQQKLSEYEKNLSERGLQDTHETLANINKGISGTIDIALNTVGGQIQASKAV